MEVLPYSDRTSSFHHNSHPDEPNPADTKAGLRKVWFLDAQWSTCPVEVYDQVKSLWRFNELGNDQYILKTSVNELIELTGLNEDGEPNVVEEWNGILCEYEEKPLKTDYIVQYIREHGIPDDEQVIIHWWW